MKKVCNGCGRESIVDSVGKCVHCAKVEGEKYLKQRFAMPVISYYALLALALFLDFVLFWKYMNETAEFRSYVIVGLMFFYVVSWGLIIYGSFTDITGGQVDIGWMWRIPVVGIISETILMIIFNDMAFWGYLLVCVAMIGVKFVAYAIYIGVSNVAVCKGKRHLAMNKILKKEKTMSKQLSQIHRSKISGYSEEELQEPFINELEYAVELVDELEELSDEDKQHVITMLRERGTVVGDINAKYGYLKVIKKIFDGFLMKNESNNRWINIISLEKENQTFPINWDSYLDVYGHKYVTENYFELYSRGEEEVNKPYLEFEKRSKELGVDEGLKCFVDAYKGAKAGFMGEKRVAEELEPYSDQMIILPGIRIEVEGESVENDFIIISPHGIHVLEVKNYAESGQYSLLIEKDGRWSKVYPDGRMEVTESADKQNARHMNYLEKLINDKLGRSIDQRIRLKGMVVIGNNNVTVENNNKNSIIKRYDSFMPVILSEEVILKEQEMHIIADIIKSEAKEHKMYEFKPSINYFNFYFETKALIKEYIEWRYSVNELYEYSEEYNANVHPIKKYYMDEEEVEEN